MRRKDICCQQIFTKAPLREKLLNSLHQANCESLGPESLRNGDFFADVFARSLNFHCDMCLEIVSMVEPHCQNEIWKPRRKRAAFFAACWKLLKTNLEQAHHSIMSSCELFTVPESYKTLYSTLLDVLHLHTCGRWSKADQEREGVFLEVFESSLSKEGRTCSRIAEDLKQLKRVQMLCLENDTACTVEHCFVLLHLQLGIVHCLEEERLKESSYTKTFTKTRVLRITM